MQSRSNLVVEGIHAGSAELECEFAEWFIPRVRAFLRVRTSRVDWIEDLTQETVVAALIALRAGRLRDLRSLGPFVFGIARNLVAEAYRHEARPSTPLTGCEIERVSVEPFLGLEGVLAMRGEIDALGETNWRILWMTVVEGARPSEVAVVVGLTEVAVRQRKSRLLLRLAAKFGASRGKSEPAP